MPRVLVIAPNWIGDALMAQPLLSRLKQSGATIDVLAPEWVAPVLHRMPEVDEVIAAPFRHGALQLGERWRLGRSLGRRGYEAAYVLPNSWKSALVPFFGRIPRRIGYAGELRYGLLNRVFPKQESAMPRHYARLANGPDSALKPPQLIVWEEEIRETCRRFGIGGHYTVLCPGAEYGPGKALALFQGARAKTRHASRGARLPEGRASRRRPAGTEFIGKTSLDEAIRIIVGASAVVSNDSGLMHVAAALGRPQVALFGSSSPEHTPPASPAARVLWLKLECSPCFERECPLGHFRCMKEITVEQVIAAMDRA